MPEMKGSMVMSAGMRSPEGAVSGQSAPQLPEKVMMALVSTPAVFAVPSSINKGFNPPFGSACGRCLQCSHPDQGHRRCLRPAEGSGGQGAGQTQPALLLQRLTAASGYLKQIMWRVDQYAAGAPYRLLSECSWYSLLD